MPGRIGQLANTVVGNLFLGQYMLTIHVNIKGTRILTYDVLLISIVLTWNEHLAGGL